MIRALCFIFLISFAFGGKVKFTDCGAKNVVEIRSTTCSGDVCSVKKGTKLEIEVEFVSNQDTKTAVGQLSARIGDADIQTSETDLCKKYLSCPLVKGKNYTMKGSATVPKLLPTLSTVITAKLKGDNGSIACAQLNAEVKD